MRLILFDIDGTLLHTGGAGLESLRRAFRELHGVEHVPAGVDFHGLTDPVILQALAQRVLRRELGAEEFARLTERYLAHLCRVLHTSRRFRVLPGAAELVAGLVESRAVLLGLATGNFERAAFAKLQRAGLERFFSFGGFGSDSADREELTRIALERGRARARGEVCPILVGDTVHDVRSARAAGIECLAVATGNAPEEKLREEGARWVVPSLEDPRVQEILCGARRPGPPR